MTDNNQVDYDKIPVTAEGLAELEQEYRRLVEERRPLIVERLSEARKLGDLSENSEYDSAKDELDFTDGRIAEMKQIIDRAVVIEKVCGQSSKVNLGCKVTVEFQDGKKTDFHVVGEWEANPVEKKISYRSPLGVALLGKKVGEQAEVEAPAGKVIYTVVQID